MIPLLRPYNPGSAEHTFSFRVIIISDRKIFPEIHMPEKKVKKERKSTQKPDLRPCAGWYKDGESLRKDWNAVCAYLRAAVGEERR